MSASGRIVAVDHGRRRSGVAVSDRGRIFALPAGVFNSDEALIARVVELHGESPVACVVVGLPLNMDGTIGPRAREVLAFCERLRAASSLEVVTWDERLTSFQAEELLAGARARGRRGKEQIDVVAAQLILQSYMDHLGRGGGRPESGEVDRH